MSQSIKDFKILYVSISISLMTQRECPPRDGSRQYFLTKENKRTSNWLLYLYSHQPGCLRRGRSARTASFLASTLEMNDPIDMYMGDDKIHIAAKEKRTKFWELCYYLFQIERVKNVYWLRRILRCPCTIWWNITRRVPGRRRKAKSLVRRQPPRSALQRVPVWSIWRLQSKGKI